MNSHWSKAPTGQVPLFAMTQVLIGEQRGGYERLSFASRLLLKEATADPSEYSRHHVFVPLCRFRRSLM